MRYVQKILPGLKMGVSLDLQLNVFYQPRSGMVMGKRRSKKKQIEIYWEYYIFSNFWFFLFFVIFLKYFFWHFWHYKYISLLLRWRSKASKWWLHFLCMFKPSFLDLLFWILCQFQNIWKCRWLWSHQISRIMLYPISKMSQTRSRYYYILFTYREIIILIIVSPPWYVSQSSLGRIPER